MPQVWKGPDGPYNTQVWGKKVMVAIQPMLTPMMKSTPTGVAVNPPNLLSVAPSSPPQHNNNGRRRAAEPTHTPPNSSHR